jgi:hypothetical protein
LDYIPTVQSLTVRIYTDLQNCPIKNSHTRNSYIRSLEISISHNISFNQIEEFFKNSFKRLENVKFFFKTDVSSQSCLDYINDKRWESVLQSLLALEHFYCCIEFPVQSECITN